VEEKSVVKPATTPKVQPVSTPSTPESKKEEVKPVERRTPKRHSKSMSTPSIKRALRGEFKDEKVISAKEQHELYSKEGEVEPFNEEALKEKWDIFLKTLDDRPNMQATLSVPPKIQEDYSLLLEIDNRIQEELIANIRPELVSFLRKELRNSKVALKTLVTEIKREKVIYSDIERYQALAGKNPDLAYLKKKLNLDF